MEEIQNLTALSDGKYFTVCLLQFVHLISSLTPSLLSLSLSLSLSSHSSYSSHPIFSHSSPSHYSSPSHPSFPSLFARAQVLSKVRAMQEENRRLDQTVVELQNSVAERQNIWRIRQRDAPLPGSTEVRVYRMARAHSGNSSNPDHREQHNSKM